MKVFISYSRKDAEFVERLKTALEAGKVGITIDVESLAFGDDLQEFVERSVRETDLTIAVISRQSLQSVWVIAEALENLMYENVLGRKKYLPIYIDTSFRDDSLYLQIVEQIDASLATLNDLIMQAIDHHLGTAHLDQRRKRLLALRNNLDTILERLASFLVADFSSDEKFAENLPKLFEAIAEAETQREQVTGRPSRYLAPFQAPPLPQHFVPRPEVTDALKARLLNTTSTTPGILVVSAIHGLGGIGKSTLAAALAYDKEVQQRFPDGILWHTLGQQPDILSMLSAWIQTMRDYDFRPTTVKAASAHLRMLLQDKAVLLVVDDVWNPEHALPFKVGGPRCQVLITTRRADVADEVGAELHQMDVMTPEQSLELLSVRIGKTAWKDIERIEALEVAKAAGYLPLALELATARLNRGTSWTELRQILLHQSLESKTFEDVRLIKLAIGDQSFRDYPRLAEAIIRRMPVTDSKLIQSSDFENGTVWEVLLPSLGLQLRTRKTVLFFRQKEENYNLYEILTEIAFDKDAAFLMILDIADVRKPPPIISPPTIWFRPESLGEMFFKAQEELQAWLGRFITTQVDMKPLLPYQTKGNTELFFGREPELMRLIGGKQHGGIIVGAHRSGKTSLLYQICKRLQQRHRQVIGPITLGGLQHLQYFFETTLHALDLLRQADSISPEQWASILRAYHDKTHNSPVFLLDEIDDFLKLDTAMHYTLGKQMRSLQSDGKCEFYLAGHAKLREAIRLEGGPFRNFAEEVTLTGLTETAGLRLIQQPIHLIGFEINDEQARRIFNGTAGVPVLIQEFCIRVLLGLRDFNNPTIEDSAIVEIEQTPDYLQTVFEHYLYAQIWDSKAVMLIAAILGEVTRSDLIREFNKRGVLLTRDRLDEILEFLVKFGVLREYVGKPGHYSIWSSYLAHAIMTREPEQLLDSEIEKGKREEQ